MGGVEGGDEVQGGEGGKRGAGGRAEVWRRNKTHMIPFVLLRTDGDGG